MSDLLPTSFTVSAPETQNQASPETKTFTFDQMGSTPSSARYYRSDAGKDSFNADEEFIISWNVVKESYPKQTTVERRLGTYKWRPSLMKYQLLHKRFLPQADSSGKEHQVHCQTRIESTAPIMTSRLGGPVEQSWLILRNALAANPGFGFAIAQARVHSSAHAGG
jgi:hypothetical protein